MGESHIGLTVNCKAILYVESDRIVQENQNKYETCCTRNIDNFKQVRMEHRRKNSDYAV